MAALKPHLCHLSVRRLTTAAHAGAQYFTAWVLGCSFTVLWCVSNLVVLLPFDVNVVMSSS